MKLSSRPIVHTVILIASLVTIVVIGMVYGIYHPIHKGNKEHFSEVCKKETCGAIDPVSDPAYNMKEIAKQSILLEEHLAEMNKRCLDCITKHFLHIIGLSEEAMMLCSRNFADYPHLDQSQEFYQGLFNTWLAHKEDESVITNVLEELRAKRKAIIHSYYLGGKDETSVVKDSPM